MSNDNRIVSIQYLRGLAALGVVFCHYGSNLTLYPKLSTFFNFGQNGVSVFFLITGFVIVYSLIKEDYKPQLILIFLQRRLIRIEPPYLVTIILTIVLFKILTLLPSFKGYGIAFIPGQFIAHIFYTIPFTKFHYYSNVFWTLSIEVQFYILIGALYFLSSHHIYKLVFLLLFSLTCLLPISSSVLFYYSPIFAVGISLIDFYKNRTWQNSILPLLLLILVLCKFGLADFILLAFTSLMIISFRITIRPLKILGDISYSLYLIHPLVLIVFIGVAKKLSFNLNQNQVEWLFIEILTAIATSFLFYILIEIPSTNLSKKIKY